MMHITIVAGARPNFMKIAPIIHEIEQRKKEGVQLDYRLVHTGQHYDKNLSATFFKQLNIPYPNKNLRVKRGSQVAQIAEIMISFEKELMANPADLVLVVGDVTSTMACTIAAKKLQIKVAHVEGGIRSFDLSMPEEINRMLTDAISDYFYVTSSTAMQNLENEGVTQDKIFFTGNTMIDTLRANLERLKPPKIWKEHALKERNYLVVTLHRPANVDEEYKLKEFIEEISIAAKDTKVIFPVHPRTKAILTRLKLDAKNMVYTDPMGYLEFNYLVKHSLGVITDSGGITEEATYLKVPCLTLRNNTERPETVTIGTNMLVGTDPKKIAAPLKKILQNQWKKGGIPEFWDGKTSERIVDHLVTLI